MLPALSSKPIFTYVYWAKFFDYFLAFKMQTRHCSATPLHNAPNVVEGLLEEMQRKIIEWRKWLIS